MCAEGECDSHGRISRTERTARKALEAKESMAEEIRMYASSDFGDGLPSEELLSQENDLEEEDDDEILAIAEIVAVIPDRKSVV